jgi:magnesium transporter
VSLGRLLVFVQQATNSTMTQDTRGRFRTLSRDVGAMSDHATFLNDKVQFALDATLGMVTIDQNNILKIFSVVTVFLLPPSVIAGFYGMNFEHIPWLHEPWGWEAAVAMMALSALLPYLWFKRKGWL